jgi:hypothetical protein
MLLAIRLCQLNYSELISKKKSFSIPSKIFTESN